MTVSILFHIITLLNENVHVVFFKCYSTFQLQNFLSFSLLVRVIFEGGVTFLGRNCTILFLKVNFMGIPNLDGLQAENRWHSKVMGSVQGVRSLKLNMILEIATACLSITKCFHKPKLNM